MNTNEMTTSELEDHFSEVAGWIDDVIFFNHKDRLWYYWDWTYYPNGPFNSEHEARIDLVLYCWLYLNWEENKYGCLPKYDRHIEIALDLL